MIVDVNILYMLWLSMKSTAENDDFDTKIERVTS
jgi:hypothetical protein